MRDTNRVSNRPGIEGDILVNLLSDLTKVHVRTYSGYARALYGSRKSEYNFIWGTHNIVGNLKNLKDSEKAFAMLSSPDKETRDFCIELIKQGNI